MKLINKNKKNKGFTLIEIIVVLVIMVIMAAIAVPAVTGYIKDAQNSQYITEADTISTIAQVENAKLKAQNSTENLVTKVNSRLSNDDSKIVVSSITVPDSTHSQWVLEFTSENGKKVKVTYTPGNDDAKVEYVASTAS